MEQVPVERKPAGRKSVHEANMENTNTKRDFSRERMLQSTPRLSSNLIIDTRNPPVRPVPAPRRNIQTILQSPSPTPRHRVTSPSRYYSGNIDRQYDRRIPSSPYTVEKKDYYPSSRNTDYRHDHQYNQPRLKSIDMPKGLKYDGTTNWRTFYTKFQRYADRLSWSTTERKDQLCWCLQGKAGDFYTNLIDRDENIDYFQLIHKLEKRFNYQDLPETLQIQFMSARQNQLEKLEDWADRVLSLACKAYRDLPDSYMYSGHLENLPRLCGQGCGTACSDRQTQLCGSSYR